MEYETTANPAGGDDTRPEEVASPDAGMEAYAIDDDGMAEPPGDGEGEEQEPFEDDDDIEGEYATVEVEYEGRPYSVPRELKDALLRQADYTRKTMDVADQRRQVAAERAGIEQVRAMTADEIRVSTRLHDIQAELGSLAQHDWANLDPRHPYAQELRGTAARLIDEQNMLYGRLAEHQHYQFAREQQDIARTRAETDHAMAREIQDWSPARRQALENFAVMQGIPDELIGHASAAEMRILNLAFLGAQQVERQRAANRGAYRPAAEVGGSAGSGPSDPSRMTMAQYRAWRAKQK